MDESKRDVSVDFAGEGVVDGVSSVDASAGGLDFDGAPGVVFSVFARLVCRGSERGRTVLGSKFPDVLRAEWLLSFW